MKLDFKVGMVSLAGIIGTFPRGFGNYFTINYQGSEAMVINLSHEDFCDIKLKGLAKDGIECNVFGFNGNYAVVVVDERIPAKCLECWHTYHLQGTHVANIVRFLHDIDGFGCVVETNPELTSKVARQTSYDYDSKPGYRIRTITCGCCNKQHTMKPEVYDRFDTSEWIVEIDRTSKPISGE